MKNKIYICKICNIECSSLRSFCSHTKNHHALKIIEYMVKYEGFEVPKCPYCKKNKKYKSGLSFRKTCCSSQCLSKQSSMLKHSDETKDKIRKKRLKYLKNHPENTAWRLGRNPSYPEKIFIDALESYGWYSRFEIIREKCFFPYYADFAFENVKVVVEIDGSQHLEQHAQEKDKKKDELIKSLGWRVFRVPANIVQDNVQNVLSELESFIGDIKISSYTSKLLTDSEKKRIERDTLKLLKINEKKQNIENLINIISKSDIDFSKFGWVGKVATILNIPHQKVNLWMKKNMNKFYEEKCFKKSSLKLP